MMVGLLFVSIWASYMHFGPPREQIFTLFSQGTHFLLIWYIVFALIYGLIIVAFAAYFIFEGAKLGLYLNPNMKWLLGSVGVFITGGFSLFVIALFAASNACLIGGIYLLHNALLTDNTWDQGKLIWGGILFAIGLITTQSSSSKKSTD